MDGRRKLQLKLPGLAELIGARDSRFLTSKELIVGSLRGGNLSEPTIRVLLSYWKSRTTRRTRLIITGRIKGH